MKRFIGLLVLLIGVAGSVWAQTGCVELKEIDGTPDVKCVKVIKVTNGTLSCSGNVCTITISGGGGGSPGGADTNVQYNDSGSFGGVAGFIFDKTSKITLGVAGTSVGGVAFKNATSGTITVQPVTGALGTVTLSLPATTGTLALTSQLTAGTVTSVGWTGGIVSVATATTTPAFTIAGTSGGVPYFSSSSTWASSAALAANALVIGGGAGVAPATTTTGTGVVTALGVNVGSAGAFVTFNGALGTPSSGVLTNATGLPPTTGIVGWPANASGVLTNNGSGTLTWGAGGSGLTVGTTTVTSGTGGRLFYETAGNVLGEISTLTSDGTIVTFSPTVTTGTGATAGLNANANSLTTGDAFNFGSSSATSGNLIKAAITGTAALTNNTVLNISNSGATSTNAQTTYGVIISNTRTNATSGTNVALQLTASGATTANTALNVTAGELHADTIRGTTVTNNGLDLGTSNFLGFRVAGSTFGGISATTTTFGLAQTVLFGWSSNPVSVAPDVVLRRAAAANLAFGAANAASPVAQTISVQNVVTGTSNTAGAAWTFIDSGGTGTGASGGFVFQTHPLGSTGSTPNAAVTALTINSAGRVILSDGSNTIPSTGFAGATTTGIYNQGAQFGVVVAGTARMVIGATNHDITGINYSIGSDTFLGRNGAANWRWGAANAASPVAQTISTQGSRSGTDTNTGGANLTVQSGLGTGTGTISSLILQSPIAVASGTGAQTAATGLTIIGGVAQLTPYTVATLPTCGATLKGGQAYITDATLTMITGLGLAPTGGGSNVVPVFCDGTNWLIQ